MNITSHLSTALVLGSVLVSAPPALAGSGGRVRLIELPAEGFDVGDPVFSDDGSTIACVSDFSGRAKVHLYHGDEWRVVYRELGIPTTAYFVTGLSDDGSTILFTDFERSYLHRGGASMNLPRIWENGDGLRFAILLHAAAISGDGSTVAIIGKDASIPYDQDRPLLWEGDRELVELAFDPQGDPEDEYGGRRVIDLSADGGVVLINVASTGPINNLRCGPSNKAYVWSETGPTRIPPPELGLEVSMESSVVSGDGSMVFGWAGAPVVESPVRESPGIVYTWAESYFWAWNRSTGVTRVIETGAIENFHLFDTNEDGSVVIGCDLDHPQGSENFLWIDGLGIVYTDPLFIKLGINLDVDSYSFTRISRDGTRLMGSARIDNRPYALIVTIPDLTP